MRTFAQGEQLHERLAAVLWVCSRARPLALPRRKFLPCWPLLPPFRTLRSCQVHPQCILQLTCLWPCIVHAGKGVQHPGTYLGVAERAAHIRAVGANAVVLTPSYATAKGKGR